MKRKLNKGDIKGLYVPLATPMLYGKYDKQSMSKLIKSIEESVDGFVPCLSTGEGEHLSDKQWQKVVTHVRSTTKKPVIAGIKRNNFSSVLSLAKKAEKLDCDALIVPVPSSDFETAYDFFEKLVKKVKLPIIVYNTESANISSIKDLKKLDKIKKIIAIKDSSMKKNFFIKECTARHRNEIGMTVLQGMEHQLDTPPGCDGYVVSLLNIEPKAVKRMFEKPTNDTNNLILDMFYKYNLGGNWFISIKTILFQRGIFRSAEEVSLAIKP